MGTALPDPLALWGPEVSVGTFLIRYQRRGDLTTLGEAGTKSEYLPEQAKAGLSPEVKLRGHCQVR